MSAKKKSAPAEPAQKALDRRTDEASGEGGLAYVSPPADFGHTDQVGMELSQVERAEVRPVV